MADPCSALLQLPCSASVPCSLALEVSLPVQGEVLLLSASVPCCLPFEVSLPVQGEVLFALFFGAMLFAI